MRQFASEFLPGEEVRRRFRAFTEAHRTCSGCSGDGSDLQSARVHASVYGSVLPKCQALPWLDPCTQPPQTLTSTQAQVGALPLPWAVHGLLALHCCMPCKGLTFVLAGAPCTHVGRGTVGRRELRAEWA